MSAVTEASGLLLTPTSPDDPSALWLMERLSAALFEITGDSGQSSFAATDFTPPGGLFVVARDASSDAALGCGGYRFSATGIAELKRMHAVPESRGVGRATLAFLEERAAEAGYVELRLSTRAVNVHAVSFYERNGYTRIANFGTYQGRPESVCLAKPLSATSSRVRSGPLRQGPASP